MLLTWHFVFLVSFLGVASLSSMVVLVLIVFLTLSILFSARAGLGEFSLCSPPQCMVVPFPASPPAVVVPGLSDKPVLLI